MLIDATVPVVQRQYAEAGSVGVPQPGTRQQLALLANVQFGQVDYVHPLADGKGRLEMGAKIERQENHGSNTFGYATSEARPDDFQNDPARSLTYTSQQVVPAAYVTVQHTLGEQWNAQVGLRSEYTYLNGSVVGGEGIAQRGSLQQDYLSFFPSATLSREFGKEAGQNRLQLSYARRLNRPNFMQQLPLAIYQDPRSYRLGNPRLRAEFSNNLELGHQISFGQATLTSTAVCPHHHQFHPAPALRRYPGNPPGGPWRRPRHGRNLRQLRHHHQPGRRVQPEPAPGQVVAPERQHQPLPRPDCQQRHRPTTARPWWARRAWPTTSPCAPPWKCS